MRVKRLCAGMMASGAIALLLIGTSGIVARAGGGEGVTTAGYGNLRNNWDPNEPALSPAAVQSASFGKLFSTGVVGAVYAQPLIYNGDVIVTTEKAYAYGINAQTGAIVWKRHFGTPLAGSTIGCGDLLPYEGSTSTPVIDQSTGVVYLTTHLDPGGKLLSNANWELQAISAATGEEQPGYPLPIAGTPSNTPGIPFNPTHQQQRPGLLLLNGVVYLGFGSDCDFTPYRGTVVGVSTATHEIVSMWTDEAGIGADENSMAGIWQGGSGLVSDMPGRIILSTGNGVSPQPAVSNEPPETLSESVLGLAVEPGGQLKATQFYAPRDAHELDQGDEDVGSGGPVALPREYFGTEAIPHLVVQVGKDGVIHLINADSMGGYRQGPGETDADLQNLGPFAGVWGHPAVYGGQGGWIYVLESAGGGYLRALSYGLTGEGLPALTPQATSLQTFGYTSGSPLVTSNGTTEGSAVVWGVYSKNELGQSGQLRAYSAMPSGGTLPLLWSAAIGKASKFSTPTAYEGRVYLGTRDGHLLAFGSAPGAPVQAAPVDVGSVPVGKSRTATLSISVKRALRFTAPISAFGEREVSALEPKIGIPPPKINPFNRTAGPRFPPPSGSTALLAGVLKVQQPKLGAALAAGTTLHLQVTFKPDHPGPIFGVISIPTSEGTRTVSISGYGTRPGFALSVRPLAFGKIKTGSGGKALTLTFTNSWDRPETLTGFRLPGAPFRVSGLPRKGTVLAPRRAVTVSVLFAPKTAGSYRSNLTIVSDHGSVALPATGLAITGAPRLGLSSGNIDFGTVPVGHTKNVTFNVINEGTVPLIITRAIPPLGSFSTAVPLPEGITINSGQSVRVTVTFRPTAVGPAASTYVLAGNDGRGYVRVTLTGRGA